RRIAPPPPSPSSPAAAKATHGSAGVCPVDGNLDARVVEAGAAGDVGVMAGTEGGDSLPVVAGPEPPALERGDDAGPHRLGDLEPEMDLAQVVPHPHPSRVAQPPRPGVLGVHLQRSRPMARPETAEGRGGALVRC